jgi:tetratricopeptide (TPR) repeat protein
MRCLASVVAVWLVLELPLAPLVLAQDEDKGNGESRTTMRTSRRRMSGLTLEDIRGSLKKNPDDALLYYRAGLLEEQRGNLEQALRDYQESVNRKARVSDAWFRMGTVWEKSGELYDLKGMTKGRVVSGPQRRKAIDAYKAAVRARPDFADAHYRLCLVYLVGDDMREANESYQKLHDLEPKSDRTRQLLLMIYKRHQVQSRQKR